jgi:stage V sporulation protein K
LSPAKVNSLKLNLEEKSAFVIVPDNQLSLAIGKGGQNVRLAARLTEWTIDIKSESQVALERNELSTKARELDAENDAKKPLSPRTGAAPRPAKTPAKSKDKAILCSNGANLDSLFLELDNLIGLTAVKEDISSLANLLKVRAMKQRQGIQTPSPSMHLVLTGNPGTGKTTVARLIGKIYKELGAVSSGHCIEVDRSGLVAGYLGQTAIKVQTILAEARGGVLFIDEAYALAGRSEGDYGNEAIATLAKAMEDHRDDLIVIVAGYQDQMHNFLDSNPGIRSRFNKYIHFPDYSPDELFRIFHAMSKQTGFVIDVAAEDKVKDLLAGLHMLRGQHFGNGRTVRNVFDRVQSLQADRVVRMERPTKADLLRIKAEDVPMDGNFA